MSAQSQTTKQITALRKLYTVEPAAGVQRFKWRVSRPWNACVQEDNGNSIRIYRDLWIVRWTFLKPVKLIANAIEIVAIEIVALERITVVAIQSRHQPL